MEVRSASSVWSPTADCHSLQPTLHGNDDQLDEDVHDHVQVHTGDTTGPEPAQGQFAVVFGDEGEDECQSAGDVEVDSR